MELTETKNKKIYVVVSQTGSIVSMILKLLTGARYNHSSLALDESLEEMYSFARKYTYNPFVGAFVKESPNRGALRRFRNGADIAVIELSVTEKQYESVKSQLETMYEAREKYHYNYKGLFLAYFSKKYHTKHHYYCSEFVRAVLERAEIIASDCFGTIVRPVDFLNLPEGKIIYRGKLKKYSEFVPHEE